MIPRRLCNPKYRAFTDEAVPVATITHTYTKNGMIYMDSHGGEHYFMRKPKPILVEYQRLGYPYGKTLRGLKRFAREMA